MSDVHPLPLADKRSVMQHYADAYEVANGKPVTQDYLPLAYEHGWVVFRYRDTPHRVAARHRRGELWRMACRLREVVAERNGALA